MMVSVLRRVSEQMKRQSLWPCGVSWTGSLRLVRRRLAARRRCDDATMRRVRYVGLRVGCAWLDLLHALKTQMCPALRNLISTDLPIFLDRAHKVPATRANPFQQLVGGIPRIEQHPDLHTTGHRAPGTGQMRPHFLQHLHNQVRFADKSQLLVGLPQPVQRSTCVSVWLVWL